MKKMVYSFKEKSIKFNVDAQVAGETLEAMKKSNGGQITPEDVVNAARDEENPLHEVFDWNDASAAKAQRLHIARLLIGSIVVTFKHHESVRANYSVKVGSATSDKEKRAYVGIEEAIKPDYELQMRKEASNHLKVFAKRYEIFDYLQTEVQQVRLLIDKMEAEIEEIEAAAEIEFK